MTATSVEIYRGWRIEPFAIPCADGSWLGTCEIRQTDVPDSEGTQAMLANVVRQSKSEAIADIRDCARHEIDSIFGLPCPADPPP
jgi:hypothetical protein